MSIIARNPVDTSFGPIFSNERRKAEFLRDYRRNLAKSPYYNLPKIISFNALTNEDIEVVMKKLGYAKAQHLLYQLGIDVDYSPIDAGMPREEGFA